tara:strand:+ start:86 stop:442 length:357 start_codon:yes stop_codon:yes gene_type:complete
MTTDRAKPPSVPLASARGANFVIYSATEIETMADKCKIEIFSSGCALCEETAELVNRMACSNCEVVILDMNEAGVVARAKELGVRSLPAVAVNGTLASCCAGRGPEETALRAAGVGAG